jgi:hypothetical protein
MGVIAIKTITGSPDYQIQREWECGSFDLLQDSDPGNGWTELSRDCDQWPQGRRTLYPYASGNNGSGAATNPPLFATFRKYFPETTDAEVDELDFSDVNAGVLPSAPCQSLRLYQNGKKLPCEAYSIDYGTAIVTISAGWMVPGASYEVDFDAAVSA